MRVYIVRDLGKNILGIFTTEELAKASLDLTCLKVQEQKADLEVIEWPVYDRVEHL